MGVLAERPGQNVARAAVTESLGQHLRHWLRDRLVAWFGALLKSSRKIYAGPGPDEEASEDAPRARRDPMRRDPSAEVAAAAPGIPPPKKRSKAWLFSGLALMFFLGVGGAASLAYWYFESTIEANDKLTAAAVKEAKAAEKKIADAQRAISTLKEDLATMKSMRQSDQARIQQLTNLLRNRGTEVPAAPPVSSAAPGGAGSRPAATTGIAPTARSQASASGGCTLTGAGAGEQFKECVAAMNAGQR